MYIEQDKGLYILRNNIVNFLSELPELLVMPVPVHTPAQLAPLIQDR